MLRSCIKGFLRAKKLWVNPPKAERAKPSLSSDYNLLFKNKIGESSLDIHRSTVIFGKKEITAHGSITLKTICAMSLKSLSLKKPMRLKTAPKMMKTKAETFRRISAMAFAAQLLTAAQNTPAAALRLYVKRLRNRAPAPIFDGLGRPFLR